MTNQAFRKLEMRINIRELLWDLLSQWKAMLLIAFIMAMLVCCMKHFKDVQIYNAEAAAAKEAAEQASLPIDERIEMIMQSLPESDRGTVSLVVSEKEWIQKEKEYINDSILMQTNPNNQKVLKLIYKIDSTDVSDLPALLQLYDAYTYSDELAESIKPFISINSKNEYISELFYAEEDKNVNSEIVENGAAFAINMVLPEEADEQEVSDAITGAFIDYSKTLQKESSHILSCSDAQTTHIYHKKNADRRMSVFSNVNNLEAALKTSMAGLTEGQINAVNAIMALNNAENIQVEEPANEPLEVTAQGPGYSKKYALAGFVFGIIMYSLGYIIYLMLKGCINTATDVITYAKTRVLGELYYDSKPQGLYRLFHSKLVNKQRYGGRINSTEQTRKTLSALEASCSHLGVKCVTALKVFAENSMMLENKEYSRILGEITSNETVNKVLNIDAGIDEKQLLQLNDAVLLVSNETEVNTLGKLIYLCNEYGVRLVGSIYIASA